MRVCVYTSFEEVPGEVRQCLSYPRQQNFFLSFDWFSLLFETSLRQTVTPRIYVLLGDQEETRAALFCAVNRNGVLRRLMSLTNFYALEYAPSLAGDAAATSSLTRQLVEYIAAERPRWHLISIKLLKSDIPEMQSVSGDLTKAGFSTYPFFQYENWYVESGDKSFEAYFAERGSQLRNTITRKQKKLEKTHGFAIKVGRSESADLKPLLNDFISVYNRSWKQPEPFPDFIPTLVAECAKLGILRLGMLYVGDKPAAGQLWLNTDRKAIIYKLAYDEEYRAFGVGSILSREMFRIAIDEDHVDEIDYGVGSEPYKKEWMSAARNLVGVEAFNRKTLPGLLLIMGKTAKPAMGTLFGSFIENSTIAKRLRQALS